jgi:sterol 3beta-glucosyltransferase
MDAPEPPKRGGPSGLEILRRRLHQQRLRVAALRSVAHVGGHRDARLRVRFHDDHDVLGRAAAWAEPLARVPTAPAAPPAVVPRLSIVIQVVGSRGDVQPFLPIARRLAERHRVRLATHEAFREMVEDAGIEFFPLAGDPRELMEYMVRTGGRLLPTSLDELLEDVPRKRALVGEIAASTWRSCTEPDPKRPDAPPFRADLVVANPPSYGHIHCAEALDAPLHLVFTMPWTPTRAYPHPLTLLDAGAHRPLRNLLSYAVANTLMWVGVADLLNELRTETLGLEPISLRHGPTLLDAAEVPFTYLFPESLVPRPDDWGEHVDVAGFVFWDQADGYEPPADLAAFLAAGDPPVYVGFGSCVVQDPQAVTRTIFDALAAAGLRGVVSRGWGNLGGEAPPPHVFLVDDTPHDWLFQHCRAVCHHGGAGTTAAGLRAGLPTIDVPFFGDQFFWGQVVADHGAGPAPIPIDDLTVETLTEALRACDLAGMRERAEALGARIRDDDAVAATVDAIHRHLPLAAMQCADDPHDLATTWCETCRLRLCEAHRDARHAAHRTFEYRWVDWSVPAAPGLLERLKDLVTDAAGALETGDDDVAPDRGPRRHGVVLLGPDDGDLAGERDDEDAPVYRLPRPRPA